ncbi:hypothetical protein [Mammaliicoccus sciuri]|uniref:hypothetical protein n=1 Tax=Mammaliicoccus sciuri TaxID=1296 RepID=UPI001FB407E9|nr:hypothetical protein [Mammaliicoccus sciuri]MCJ1780368.1 hypothetical protein [Mammaliicoccus sciuri]
MHFEDKYKNLLDISDDLLYLSQLVSRVQSSDDYILAFVIVKLKLIKEQIDKC